ncbi:MAG: PKD domain-containing protein, partial [Bacteroidetes bacterium]
FKGQLKEPQGGDVVLSLDENLLHGMIEQAGEAYFIEPVWWFVHGAPKNQVVVYAASQVKPREGLLCGADYVEEFRKKKEEAYEAQPQDRSMNCWEVKIAIASDLSMFNSYGSVGAVEAHNAAILALSQTNYDNEFADEISFTISEQFVVAPPASDPWTSSNSASALLGSFAAWAPTGFTFPYDIGEIWTARDFSGATVGIAQLAAVCDGYHALQDFTSNSSLKRVLVSHEMGHNFSATHDPPGSPFIMAPAVNNTNNWSSQSVSQINAFVASITSSGCLVPCPPPAPPIADFTADVTSGCAPLTVNFQDNSLNQPSSWNWTFPGGNPGTSTEQNPTVVYNTPGVYDVTLTVSNALGSNTVTKPAFITVEGPPQANFTFIPNGWEVSFVNTTAGNPDSFSWDFGDGSTSTEMNPVHTFPNDGNYLVTLTATNECGSTNFSALVFVVIPPTADFTADVTSGCAPLAVHFQDQSSINTVAWSWEFPGGVPANSDDPNPNVIYPAAGTYDVKLTVFNMVGMSDELILQDFIIVDDVPGTNFEFSINQDTVSFTNLTTNEDGHSWDFGDGNTSTLNNPVHVYENDGTYTVALTASNTCGDSTYTQEVIITTLPIAQFSADTTWGCDQLEVTFVNQSLNDVDSLIWIFEGADPDTAHTDTVVVTYDSVGTYDVKLIVINEVGTDTLEEEQFILIGTPPDADFSFSTNQDTAFFENLSSNADSLLWDFGDGNTSSEANP